MLFIGFVFVGNSTPTHMVEKGFFFFVCISQELAVHAAVGEFMADAMVVAVDYGVSILIVSFGATFFLGGSIGFRRCEISTLFLMLNFCTVEFSINSSTLDLSSLYSEALFTGCSCKARIFAIYCCCAANYLLSCRIVLAASSLSTTYPGV